MAESQKKQKKPPETAEELVKRLNEMKKSNKRNGLMRQFGRHHR